MANPRQRRKARSSTHRPVSHSRNAKRNLKKTLPVQGPKVLQMAWKKGKTVNQNYVQLGLLHSTNPLQSGGVEHQGHPCDDRIPESATNQAPFASTAQIPQAFGKIVRDGTGAVVGVEIPGENNTFVDTEDTALLGPSIDPQVHSKWTIGGDSHTQGLEQTTKEGIVKALKEMSTPQTALHNLSFAISGVGARHASAGEVAYLKKLVKKYGEDVERMAKDRKLNPEQRTVGQLRTALRRLGLRPEDR